MSDRTDIYAVGVILFRLVSERHPFEAELARETMMKRLVDAVPNVRAFQPSVPEPLARWIDRCLARASERPAAAELARQLAAWADAAGAPRLECIVVAGNDAATLSRAGERDGAAATMRA
jgi:serine/threonine-protein kinase